MRFLFILLLVFCKVCYTNCRPLQMDEIESGINDLESEDDIEIAADAFNDEKSKQQQLSNQIDSDSNQGMLTEDSYQDSNAGDESSLDTDANLISDYKPIEKSDSNSKKYSEVMNYNEKIGLRSNRRQSNRYIENNDLNQQPEPVENFINRHVKICNSNRMRNPQNKRTIHALADEIIKKNNQINHYDNKYRGNYKDFERSNIFQRYDNENTRIDSENERNILNRDRRNVQEKRVHSELSSNNNEYQLKSGSENEELAIKKHIKRLSDMELEELLNSLSEEKRALLQKIIDDDNVNNAIPGGINKREITKKAGAVEDNNFIESVQSDASKLQSNPSADTNTESSGSHNTDTTTLKIKTENSEKADESTTNSDSENKSDLTSRSYEINQVMLDNNIHSDASNINAKNNANAINNLETAVKSEAKREINLNNMEDVDTSLDDLKLSGNDYFNDKNEHDISLGEEYNICPQYDNIAQINEGEVQSLNERSYKREVAEKEMFDSIKALEESFPNTESIGVTSSNSGPLIRVKRTDLSKHNMAKRLAEIMPETKISYYPHKTENVDEDYEEGSEFDNDIFYDRTSNIKSENRLDNIASNNNYKSVQVIDNNKNSISDSLDTVSTIENNKKGTIELGSDNDSVLSGVEGVDENLMFSNNFRNRRSLDDNFYKIIEDKINNPTLSTTIINNEIISN